MCSIYAQCGADCTFKVGLPDAKKHREEEDEEEEQCFCGVHDAELLHLSRATQCRQEPHMSLLEWALFFKFRGNQHNCNSQ